MLHPNIQRYNLGKVTVQLKQIRTKMLRKLRVVLWEGRNRR